MAYLTADEQFATFGRGSPPPCDLPLEKRRAVGLARETWQLEVVPDPDSDAKLDHPLSTPLASISTVLESTNTSRILGQSV